MNFHVRCLRKLTKDEEYHLDSQETLFFEKEEKIEKYFLIKEKDITKSIAIENVEPTKRKVRGRKI